MQIIQQVPNPINGIIVLVLLVLALMTPYCFGCYTFVKETKEAIFNDKAYYQVIDSVSRTPINDVKVFYKNKSLKTNDIGRFWIKFKSGTKGRGEVILIKSGYEPSNYILSYEDVNGSVNVLKMKKKHIKQIWEK